MRIDMSRVLKVEILKILGKITRKISDKYTQTKKKEE